MKRTVVSFVVIAILLFGSSLSFAGSWSTGDWDLSVGVFSMGIGSDLGDIIDDGYGLSLGFTNRVSKRFSYELLWVPSNHKDLLVEDNLKGSRYDLGFRFSLATNSSYDFYGSAGLSFHKLAFDNYTDYITGTYPYFGTGVELFTGKSGAVDLGIRYSSWEAKWHGSGFPDFDATTTVIHALYRFKYR